MSSTGAIPMEYAEFAWLQQVVRQAETLVLLLLPQRLSDEMLSRMCGVELQVLRQAFRKIRRTNPYAALRALRVREVKRRLDADERLSVEEAMRQCGFGTYMGFAKEFRRKFGIDPKSLRNEGVVSQATGRERRCGSLADGGHAMPSGEAGNVDADISASRKSSNHHAICLDFIEHLPFLEG